MNPISLAELVDKAELQTRIDRKYVLSRADARTVLDRLDPSTRVLEIDGLRRFRYQSTYFDTPDLISFRLAALRRRHRFKIRTRSYLDSACCWLEVKTDGRRGGTVKNRLPYQPDDHDTIAPGRSFLGDYAGLAFAPTLTTRYRRSTFYVPADQSRATLDVDLEWEDTDGRRLHLPHLAVVETKTSTGASAIDRLLWACGHRPAPISKYATGLAALRPDLPAAPWRRTMRRHFGPVAPVAAAAISRAG